jgi:hypothetical protein
LNVFPYMKRPVALFVIDSLFAIGTVLNGLRRRPMFNITDLDLEEGKGASSSEEHGAHAGEGSTTANAGRLSRARGRFRWLSRSGSGNGAVRTTPGRAVARARGSDGGLVSLGRGLNDDGLGGRGNSSCGSLGGCGGHGGAGDVDSCRSGLEFRRGSLKLRRGRDSSGSGLGRGGLSSGSGSGGQELLGLEAILYAIRSGTFNKIHSIRAAPGLSLGVVRAVEAFIT